MLNLPDPDETQLQGSPLELVVTQVRFETRDDIAEPRFGFGFRDALNTAGADFSRVEPTQNQAINVAVGPDGVPQVGHGMGQRGWRFASADGSRSVVLLPDSLGIEVREYTTWDDFRAQVDLGLRVLAEQVRPEVELRLGLRYIDRITEVPIEQAHAWAEYLAEPLRGFLGHVALRDAVTAHQQQVLFDLGDGVCRLTHGTIAAEHGRIDYVLDYDLYREEPQPFSVESVLGGLERFHTDALKLFQASTSPALKAVFA